MIINVGDLVSKLDKHKPPSIILLTSGKAPFGKADFEPWLAEAALHDLLQMYVPEDQKDLALTTLQAGESSPGDVASEVLTLPFLVERKVIVVRHAELFFALSSDKKSPVIPLLECLSDPPDFCLLILLASEANRSRRFYKLCEEKGLVVECPQMEDRVYGQWIKEQLKQKGYSISSSALALMIERVGNSMSDMANAINLLCSFAEQETKLNEQHVLAACADVAETTVWALTDAIAASNTGKALENLHELLAINKSHEEILGMINWLLESAYKAHPDTKVSLNKPFVEKKVLPLAKKWDVTKMQNALQLCTRTNFQFRNSGADKTLLLETMIIKLAASRGRAAPAR